MQMSGKARDAEQESTRKLRGGHEPTRAQADIAMLQPKHQEHSKTSSLGSLRAKEWATHGSSPPELDPRACHLPATPSTGRLLLSSGINPLTSLS